MFEFDIKYMSRALELAGYGRGYASPNPMVGAVIVHDNRIIGEGYHRRCGEGHAEVNAVKSVKDISLLSDSTMYVTLEPCSHYGKTPPCAQLIIDKKIPRVVVGATDPFIKVSGRGIKMLREAGVEVVDGVMAEESMLLNRQFFTAHTKKRPYITLKWAQSKDGFMDCRRQPGEQAARFSTRLSTVDTHRLRAIHDAILTSALTVNADDPSLTVRTWNGRSPRPVIIDRRNLLNRNATILSNKPLIYNSPDNLHEILADMYERHGITSVLVEAGPTLLQAFIDNNLWDTIRIETSPFKLGDSGVSPSPCLSGTPSITTFINDNRVDIYTK